MDELTKHSDRLPYCDCHECAIHERNRLRAELAECRAKHMDDLLVLGETAKAERELRAELAEVQEKALRFDLDQAGIEQREREAVELVTLRAELAECKRDALRYRFLRDTDAGADIKRFVMRAGWDEIIDDALAAKGE